MIGIPTFTLTLLLLIRDHKYFAKECLASISSELGDQIPIVLIDAGSRDGSLNEFLEKMNNKEGRVLVIESSRETSTLENLALGLESVSSTHIILLSGDDAFGPGYGESLLRTLKEDQKHDSVYNFMHVICNSEMKEITTRSPRWSSKRSANKRLLSTKNPGTTAGAVIPVKLLRRIFQGEPIPKTLVEDYWLWWRLIDLANFKNILNAPVLYRTHSGSTSNSRKSSSYAESLGFSASLPINERISLLNRLSSLILIPKWIRHLHYTVWISFARGYIKGILRSKSI